MDIIHKSTIMTIKDGEKKEDWLETFVHKQQHCSYFPGYLFDTYILELAD
jgi:hypothetical protein